MQSTNFKYWLLIPVIMLSSCKKYLDIEPKGQIILTTAEDYAKLFDNVGTVGTFTISDAAYLEDESWVNAQVIVNAWSAPTLTSANVLYKTDYDRSTNATGNSGTLGTTLYQSLYQNVSKVANTIIAERNDIKGTEEELKVLMAQAKVLRAFAYFHLINLYAKPYDKATAENDGGVPLKLDNSMESNPEPAKSTVAQVYAQMQKDIDEALLDLPETVATPYRFNKAAAYALKAKVHLFKKEYDECIAAALESNRLRGGTYNLVSLVNATTHKPTSSLLATGEENLYFATASPGIGYIQMDLINLYKQGLQLYGQGSTVTDVRIDLYVRPSSTIKDYMYILSYVPTSKEYSPNTVGLRTTEVMLMLAECYARKGQNEKVKQYLKPYFESRYRNYVHANLVIPADVTEAVRFVLKERRKELTMGFNRFFDLRRLNTETAFQTVPARTIPADAAASPGIPQATYTLPVNSPLYILPFPSKAFANDPRLTSNTW